MKVNIHPVYYKDARITCVCGNSFTAGSTLPEIKVDICSKCHPFFTGQQKFVDTQGQVEKFGKIMEIAKVKKAERAKIVEVRQAKVQTEKAEKPTLRDLLMQARKAKS